MTSKERIKAAWEGKSADHVPLTTWCFGLPVPSNIQWGKQRYWFSQRMEHLHTLTFPWDLEDEFNRIKAWQTLGVDDMVDVSVPWGISSDVTWKDSITGPAGDERHPVMTREYDTPAGVLRHSVYKTEEEMQEGWVVQPDHVPLIEDFNIPRAVEHAVSSPADVGPMKYLYCPPGAAEREWFEQRMNKVQPFADEAGVPVQAWTGFGMDAVVWLTGTEKAIMMSMDEPAAFHKLIDIITETDAARTNIAAAHPGVDIVTERGWYSSTDFWSPKLFDEFLFPHIKTLAAAAHEHGKKFGYVMTTGVEILGPRLADAGVDVLYFVDPIDPILSGELNLPKVRDLLSDRMTIVGGVSSLTLSKPKEELQDQIAASMEVFKPTNRFILHPVDALFPDTSWEGIENLIEIWKKYR
jgi:hypothetical protein